VPAQLARTQHHLLLLLLPLPALAARSPLSC
jgi:hypothetical protein